MGITLSQSALCVVDVQQGFTELCPEELPVPNALSIVPNVNRLLDLNWARIDATQDWHPPQHCSFLGQRDDIYPPHCVAGTPGADFLSELKTERFHAIWRKGFEEDRDAYAVTAQHPEIISLFQSREITTVVVCGLATNICCFYTARDLREAGFRVLQVEDASAGIDVEEAKLFQEQARTEGIALGIEYVSTQEILNAVREAGEGE